jgi:tRNA threonylcarbamoyladenosine biosynthesis protein TsaE
MKRILRNESETRAFGLELAGKTAPGTVFALSGDLGAGKTTLTKAIAEGLGVTETVTSPTFAIIKEYTSGRLPLYHFDVYRISDAEEMHELGFEEYFYGNGVAIVEWANLVEELLPPDAIAIELSYGRTADERLACMTGNGDAF